MIATATRTATTTISQTMGRLYSVRVPLLGLAVGIVLADSSIVTIALPKILGRYEVDVETLAWTLTSFNLALGVAALPAAFAARHRAKPVFAAGVLVFAVASVTCAIAPSFDALVAARAVQGVAGAAVVCAALDLLIGATGSEASAARTWAFVGILGAALGPAAGGILTQLLGWQSIFAVQVPLILLTAAVLLVTHASASVQRPSRPDLAANAALVLVSGALVGALFLLVILLINVWRLPPLAAGLVVTLMPIAAIVAARFGRAIAPTWARAAAGVILVSGGLAALAWLPGTRAAWTAPPQLAVGAGLGLALSALTERALVGRPSLAVQGGWTLAARHAGVVLGLLLLTPIFAGDLDRSRDDALAAGTSFVLESRISPLDKLAVARDVLVAVDDAKEEARVPDVRDAIGTHGDDPAFAELAESLQGELDRAVTTAFSRAFLVAALLALLAVIPILLHEVDA